MGDGLNPVHHPLAPYSIGIFSPKSTHVPNPGRGKIILDPEIVSPLRNQWIVRPGNHAFRDHLATYNPLGFNSNVIKALCAKSNQCLKCGYRIPVERSKIRKQMQQREDIILPYPWSSGGIRACGRRNKRVSRIGDIF